MTLTKSRYLALPAGLVLWLLASPAFAEKVAELYEERTAPDGAVKALESRFGGPFRRFGDDLPTILGA